MAPGATETASRSDASLTEHSPATEDAAAELAASSAPTSVEKAKTTRLQQLAGTLGAVAVFGKVITDRLKAAHDAAHQEALDATGIAAEVDDTPAAPLSRKERKQAERAAQQQQALAEEAGRQAAAEEAAKIKAELQAAQERMNAKLPLWATGISHKDLQIMKRDLGDDAEGLNAEQVEERFYAVMHSPPEVRQALAPNSKLPSYYHPPEPELAPYIDAIAPRQADEAVYRPTDKYSARQAAWIKQQYGVDATDLTREQLEERVAGMALGTPDQRAAIAPDTELWDATPGQGELFPIGGTVHAVDASVESVHVPLDEKLVDNIHHAASRIVDRIDAAGNPQMMPAPTHHQPQIEALGRVDKAKVKYKRAKWDHYGKPIREPLKAYVREHITSDEARAKNLERAKKLGKDTIRGLGRFVVKSGDVALKMLTPTGRMELVEGAAEKAGQLQARGAKLLAKLKGKSLDVVEAVKERGAEFLGRASQVGHAALEFFEDDNIADLSKLAWNDIRYHRGEGIRDILGLGVNFSIEKAKQALEAGITTFGPAMRMGAVALRPVVAPVMAEVNQLANFLDSRDRQRFLLLQKYGADLRDIYREGGLAAAKERIAFVDGWYAFQKLSFAERQESGLGDTLYSLESLESVVGRPVTKARLMYARNQAQEYAAARAAAFAETRVGRAAHRLGLIDFEYGSEEGGPDSVELSPEIAPIVVTIAQNTNEQLAQSAAAPTEEETAATRTLLRRVNGILRSGTKDAYHRAGVMVANFADRNPRITFAAISVAPVMLSLFVQGEFSAEPPEADFKGFYDHAIYDDGEIVGGSVAFDVKPGDSFTGLMNDFHIVPGSEAAERLLRVLENQPGLIERTPLGDIQLNLVDGPVHLDEKEVAYIAHGGSRY